MSIAKYFPPWVRSSTGQAIHFEVYLLAGAYYGKGFLCKYCNSTDTYTFLRTFRLSKHKIVYKRKQTDQKFTTEEVIVKLSQFLEESSARHDATAYYLELTQSMLQK